MFLRGFTHSNNAVHLNLLNQFYQSVAPQPLVVVSLLLFSLLSLWWSCHRYFFLSSASGGRVIVAFPSPAAASPRFPVYGGARLLRLLSSLPPTSLMSRGDRVSKSKVLFIGGISCPAPYLVPLHHTLFPYTIPCTILCSTAPYLVPLHHTLFPCTTPCPPAP